MREIKFRALGLNGWLYFTLEQLIEGSATNFEEYNLKHWTQYTGFKDSKGVEMYEGDIVRATARKEDSECSRISDVIFTLDTAFSVRDGEEYDFGLSLNWGGWESFEIIGNIYENPELLSHGSVENTIPSQ